MDTANLDREVFDRNPPSRQTSEDSFIFLSEGASTMIQKLAFIISICATTSLVKAEVLFEGYSKVLSGGVHVGFVINRYDYDPKKKIFTSISLLKTNELGGNITESVKAIAKDDLTPVEYSYTTLVGGQPKTIDAKFKKGKMLAVIKDGKKVTNVNRDISKDVFLSTFLIYKILKSPKGITVDTMYNYQAIAEEDAAVVKGFTMIKSIEEVNGIKTYRTLNEFKGTKFISFVTAKGEVISTKSPVQGIGTELVPQSSMATTGLQIPTALLKTLFGDIPMGIKNEISKMYQDNPKMFQTKKTGVEKEEEAANPSSGGPSKGAQVPPGKGILLKGGKSESGATPEAGK